MPSSCARSTPSTYRYVFSLRDEASTKNGLLGVVDRLSDRARRELQEPAAEVDAGSIRVGDAVSRSLEAYQHYTAGMDRYYREGDVASAVAEFRKAVELDPDFSAAHLELSALDFSPEGPARNDSGNPTGRVEPFWSPAMAGVDRMPEKERLWVKLAGAVLGFHAIPAPAEAERLATELEERFPDDKVSLLKVSGALRSLARIQVSAEDRATMDSRATRAIRRVVELDPGYRQAAADLISIEQAAGNGASAIRIARNLIAARQSAETHAALAQALAFDGLCEDALRHVDEAITRSPNGSCLATVDSSTALVACGRFQEAEREVVRFLAAAGDRYPRSRLGANIRAYGLMALQGHCAEAARHAEASVSHAWWYRGTRALLLSCGHDRLQAPRAREYVRSGWTAGGRGNGATGAARLASSRPRAR